MTDETDKPDEEEGPVGGERLRAARRANDISIRDVAKELHLDEPKVRALEKNEFDVLGAPVFAKGHLRKYAELVGVPIDDIMADYYMMNRASGAPPVVGRIRKQPRDINLAPWIGGVFVLIVVAAALYWWFVLRSTVPASSAVPATLAPFATEAEDQSPADTQPVPGPAVADDAAVEQVVDAPVQQPETSSRQPEPVVSVAESSSGLPQVEVDLSYTGDCWTEVSDASGRRLFYDLGQAGRVVTLSGDAPLRIILGDSENVGIAVDGRDWPIPASARSGKLARLTINSQ